MGEELGALAGGAGACLMYGGTPRLGGGHCPSLHLWLLPHLQEPGWGLYGPCDPDAAGF